MNLLPLHFSLKFANGKLKAYDDGFIANRFTERQKAFGEKVIEIRSKTETIAKRRKYVRLSISLNREIVLAKRVSEIEVEYQCVPYSCMETDKWKRDFYVEGYGKAILDEDIATIWRPPNFVKCYVATTYPLPQGVLKNCEMFRSGKFRYDDTYDDRESVGTFDRAIFSDPRIVGGMYSDDGESDDEEGAHVDN